MTVPGLNETLIQQHTTSQSFDRGLHYYDYGAVVSIVQRGTHIQAEVEGSQYEPYQVTIAWDAGGITDIHCSCPYDWGGWCKHIVASLLTVLHDHDDIEERAPLSDLVAGLDKSQLEQVILRLADRSPDIATAIEAQIAMLHPSEPAPAESTRKTDIDTTAIRRQIRYALQSLGSMRPSEAYWHVGEVVDEIYELADRANDFLDGGDAHNALAILEAVTDEYIGEWYYLDDSSGEASGFFYTLGPLWAEALLLAELSEAERDEWAGTLSQWQAELSDYGIDDVFDPAQNVAVRGWTAESLAHAFIEEEPSNELPDDETVWCSDDLIDAGLNVLERQGRYDLFRDLAKATHRVDRYLTALIRQGEVDQAVDDGIAMIRTTGEALAIAKLLREHGHVDAALALGEHGLTTAERRLDDDTPPDVQFPHPTLSYGINDAGLATWLRDFARGLERSELALRAADVAVRAAPNLEAYLALHDIAGETWPALREQLLDDLRARSTRYSQGVIDIFVHEGLIDDAIDALGDYAHYSHVQTVMEAAIERERRPEWVIATARRQADAIMDQGKSGAYRQAVEWLRRARAGYRIADRQDEWRSYLESLIQKHNRKWKLRPMLEELRRS